VGDWRMSDKKIMDKGLTIEIDLKVSECPCGSGKKPAKCCGKMKPRTYSITVDERNYHESDGISFNKHGSLMRNVDGELLPIIGQAKLSYGYNRAKGTKVLLSGDANGGFLLNPESVLQGYDNLFAIDTNTKSIDGNDISVSVVVHAYVENTGQDVILNFVAVTAFEFWNVAGSPEKLGWYALVDAIITNEAFQNKNAGIIVDSDLGCLEDINSQREYVLKDFLLPERYKLIYASADLSNNGANKLIKHCDKRANEVMEYIRQNPSKDNLVLSEAYPCEYFRQWQFNDNQ